MSLIPTRILAGDWLDNSGKNLTSESWRKVSDKTIEGYGLVRRKEAGEIRNQEALMISEMDGQIFYIAKPKQNSMPAVFTLISCDANNFLFTHSAHDFPQQIRYHYFPADDKQTEHINVDVRNNQGQGFGLTFFRIIKKRIKKSLIKEAKSLAN